MILVTWKGRLESSRSLAVEGEMLYDPQGGHTVSVFSKILDFDNPFSL